MAELPDIDTSTVSFLAYWNAIDDGGIAEADMDPASVTSYGGIESYTLYDNGIQGKLSGPTTDPNETFFRVKSDGWIVVWCGREAQYGDVGSNRDNIWGPWEIIDWSGNTPENNLLSQEISSLHSNLSTTGTFVNTDAGLYNYEHSSATTFSVFAQEGSFSYTSGTNLLWSVGVGYHEDSGQGSSNKVYIDGENGQPAIVSIPASNYGPNYGARDFVAQGDITNSATEYTLSNTWHLSYLDHSMSVLWS